MSIVNVPASVVLMAITLPVLLRREGFAGNGLLVGGADRHQHVALSIVSTIKIQLHQLRAAPPVLCHQLPSA
jgi:hypothetical protein